VQDAGRGQVPDRPIAGRYELLERLGNGGMGDVWRGYDAVLDRPVAVKRIRPQTVAATPQLAEELERRFRREARITARIQHPGVPQVYDAVLDSTHEHLFLVMELVEGVTLTRYVHEERPLPVSWRSPRRSPPCCRTRTTYRWCTATSSRRTSWWRGTAR
jgi:serine/threonine protein kinase